MDTASLIALLEIIGINIVLSGDNAVVIALACRSLPPRQQRYGIILGAGAAVVLRILFTIFVVYLMAVPFLKLAGGLLLLWIGYKLMVEEEQDESSVEAAGHLFGAIRTIMIADAVMSLDNVIAVAAAARGNHVLLVLGLLISIPLVVYGATLMMTLIRRFPFIVTLGGALIGYVGGEVIVSDPAIEPWVNAHAHWLHVVAPLLAAVLVVDSGRFFAPARTQVPHDSAEATAASLSLFGFSSLAVALGELVLARAPLIVSFAFGLLGYVGADELLPSHGEAPDERGLMRAVGPILGAGLALVIAEVAGRLAHFTWRRTRDAASR
ncbi:MAG: TerC family protein [Acetobacteraceae bacterium]|nr:TerC family protein [Pseudomonadota bacterium]